MKKETKDILSSKNITLITYKRKNQIQQNTQEEKILLKKRHKVENLFEKLKFYKRILLRHEKNIINFTGFLYLGFLFVTENIFSKQ